MISANHLQLATPVQNFKGLRSPAVQTSARLVAAPPYSYSSDLAQPAESEALSKLGVSIELGKRMAGAGEGEAEGLVAPAPAGGKWGEGIEARKLSLPPAPQPAAAESPILRFTSDFCRGSSGGIKPVQEATILIERLFVGLGKSVAAGRDSQTGLLSRCRL